MTPFLPLLAQATRTSFEFGRIRYETDWALPLLAFAALVVYVIVIYRRDAVELGRLASVWLVGLRLLALAGLLVVYLQPQWRNERDAVQNSRVLVLVDTSLSMDADDNDASPTEPHRAEKVAAVLAEGRWLNELRQTHDVVVSRFDQDLERLATLTKRTPSDTPQAIDTEPSLDWHKLLQPRGSETNLGEAIKRAINDERGAPLSSLIVFTDGQHNAGLDPADAVPLARDAKLPIYPVGMGSDRRPINARISDLTAPARAYPSDKFSVTGFIQAQGLADKDVTVELLQRSGSDANGEPLALVEKRQVTLAGDGETTSVKFELPSGSVGRRTLSLRLTPPQGDRNPQDNQRDAVVEVVDRKTKVLLFAGGPSREYQFLRNQLRRDKDVTVDVLLQTGTSGISQDANEILEEFPSQREELYEYDSLIAFDPDWRELSAAQVDLLEQWVGEQAGGLVVIAGPIFTAKWIGSPSLSKVRDLYPVEFLRRFSDTVDETFAAKEPWPLEFTSEGAQSPFLWLADTQTSGLAAWERFKGVYGYYEVRGAKPAATVYARFGNPQLKVGDSGPVYLAGQFYGSGRVFYLGSGEMWRLRAESEGYFETLYTKLIRHVSQGRLLRGSSRGVLLTERDRYVPGNTVDLRAQLNNALLEPLKATHVTVNVYQPDGRGEAVRLLADASRAGNFRGQFTVRKEGSYRLEVSLPDSDTEIVSAPPIQVTVPDLERDHTERNDPLLSALAKQTQGDTFQYYVGLDAMLGTSAGSEPLTLRLRDASRTETVTARPETLWDNEWMLALVCGALCLEWLTRRLLKLA